MLIDIVNPTPDRHSAKVFLHSIIPAEALSAFRHSGESRNLITIYVQIDFANNNPIL